MKTHAKPHGDENSNQQLITSLLHSQEEKKSPKQANKFMKEVTRN